MSRLAIIDYGMGNLASVAKAFVHVAPEVTVLITADPAEIARADRVVLPGQSAMPDTMRALHTSGLFDATMGAIRSKPFMGVCLGLQMLLAHSEEGDCAALGVLPGVVNKFPKPLRDRSGQILKVPHMGWNTVHLTQSEHPCFKGLASGRYFYFAHSYYAAPANSQHIAATVNYPEPFAVALAHDNLFAVQFHPEKSAHAGLQILQNFTRWTAS
jgi:imidazole glycerol-phosphate synthase subunit HisH